MFNKEELAKIQAQLEAFEKKHEESIKDIKSHQEQKFKHLEDTLSQLKEKQFFYFEEFEKSIASFNDLNIKYKKEFDTLNIIKNNLTSKVLEKLEKELKDELNSHFVKLGLEKAKFSELSKSIETAKEEIRRLALLAEKIKSADLELTRHSQELKNNDVEKLKLLKQIDELQALIGRMRQNRHL